MIKKPGLFILSSLAICLMVVLVQGCAPTPGVATEESSDSASCKIEQIGPAAARYSCLAGEQTYLIGGPDGTLFVTEFDPATEKYSMYVRQTSSTGESLSGVIDLMPACLSGRSYCKQLYEAPPCEDPSPDNPGAPRCPPMLPPCRPDEANSCNDGGPASFDFCNAVNAACDDVIFGAITPKGQTAACAASIFC
jgi:hypothetical protein